MAENRTSERLPIAREPYEYRLRKDLTTRSFCHAQWLSPAFGEAKQIGG